jgi:hypothetical protein
VLGQRLGKPQSWVYNCETGNRRVDVTELAAWARSCGTGALAVFRRFLELDSRAEEHHPPASPSEK